MSKVKELTNLLREPANFAALQEGRYSFRTAKAVQAALDNAKSMVTAMDFLDFCAQMARKGTIEELCSFVAFWLGP